MRVCPRAEQYTLSLEAILTSRQGRTAQPDKAHGQILQNPRGAVALSEGRAGQCWIVCTSLRLEGPSELLEGVADAVMHPQVRGDRVVPVAQVLHERVPGGDGAR